MSGTARHHEHAVVQSFYNLPKNKPKSSMPDSRCHSWLWNRDLTPTVTKDLLSNV